MNNRAKLFLAAAFALSTFTANAQCDHVNVDVAPLTIAHNFTTPYSQIPGYGNEVGAVVAVFKKSIDECNVTVGWTNGTLYVAEQLTRNQCAFNHVLKHELEHVRIYTDGVAGIESRINARVAAGQSIDAAVDAEADAIRAQHHDHDSPTEYRTNVTACGGAIVRLARL